MEWVVAILAVALIASLGWIARLRTQQSLPSAPAPESPDLFFPLFRSLSASVDGGVILLTEEHIIRDANQQAEVLLGVERDRMLGVSLINIIRDHHIDTLLRDVFTDGESREMGFQPLVGGRKLWLRAARLQSEAVTGTILQLRDVTQIGALERSRRDLVANVSHELRNPLASVKLLVETLQSEPPPTIAAKMLNQMAQEVDAITQLVDELHELSQIESGRVLLKLLPQPLEPIIAKTIERIQPQTERKMLVIGSQVAADLPLVLVDVQRIGQVLLNLFHNAVKFTPNSGTIVIRAQRMIIDPGGLGIGMVERLPDNGLPPIPSLARQLARGVEPGRATLPVPESLSAGEWVLVTITDTGIGIPAPDLPRIFERFYKVDRARTRNAGGTGLGLAIAKHLIEGHGGRIWATSEEGAGSTFYVVLAVA
jgi:two-component system phosphate regulon sensor histidine kinase PhoR